ncbi:hypothetical protein EH2252_3346 [Escherichia coli]|nr:hypothetical protein EH2252_3346 [Escherichia coli]
MDSFAKYTIIDWIAFLQVLLIWFYMAYRSVRCTGNSGHYHLFFF